MSVLIKGMEMPKTGCIILAIRADGVVEGVDGTIIGKSIEVKAPHGDLVDRDTLMNKEGRSQWWDDNYAPDVEMDDIKNAPTVIEAEK